MYESSILRSLYKFSFLVHQININAFFQVYLIAIILSYQSQMLSKFLKRSFFTVAQFCKTPQEAIQGIKDGSFLLVGGFGVCGVPMNLIKAVRDSGAKNLTIASNNCGVYDKVKKLHWGLSILLETRQIKRMKSSYVGENAVFEGQYFNGELELDICPQGTLAEKIRAGGAGIPAFYTATGVDTIIETGGFPIKFKNQNGKVVMQGKERVSEIESEPKVTSTFNGKKYLLEESIYGDFSLVKAKRADRMGNLFFDKTERNFNGDIATASKCVIAEVEEIVENGQIKPEDVHVPAVYVKRVFKSDPKNHYSRKLIEKLTVCDYDGPLPGNIFEDEIPQLIASLKKSKQEEKKVEKTDGQDEKIKIANRAARQVKNGMNVNLGIGIPTLLPSALSKDVYINLQSENGVMGVGSYPELAKVLANLINAGKETITTNEGGSYFPSSQSFAIIRGGHLDITMLGALEVSEDCDIANWYIPQKMMRGMGGAMDLVACGSKVIVLMTHSAFNKKTKQQDNKLVKKCNLPLTAKGVVSMVITQLAVFENRNGKLVLIEIAEKTTLEKVQSLTGFTITCAEAIGRF